MKLLKALALSHDRVDMNVAFGEAVPVVERLKTAVIVALVAVALLLTIAYVTLQREVAQTQSNLESAVTHFDGVIGDLQAEHVVADRERAEMLALLRGK